MWVCCVIQQSLMATIVNLAQNFVGSNNLNILMPIGQFGTRLQGGKDSASPRYIFTMLRLDILSYFTSLCQQWLCMSRIIHTSILHNAYIARTVIVVWVSVCSCVNLHNSTANKPWSPNLAQSLTWSRRASVWFWGQKVEVTGTKSVKGNHYLASETNGDWVLAHKLCQLVSASRMCTCWLIQNQHVTAMSYDSIR